MMIIKIDKIKVYLFKQILKYFSLILFIFLSVAWLLQITRLFSITNFLYIEISDILLLSIYLIPNIITIIIPFILIFGLLLSFIKLKKDNELIAMLSLGFGLKPLKDTLIFFSIIIITLFCLLNFYLAPKIYEIYKIKEFDLRNTLNFNKMSFSNFINLDNSTILDFEKKNNEYKDIFLSFNDDKENIVYATEGNIFSKNNQYNFRLTNGFKISIDKNKQIEKLEFQNYILKIDNKNINTNKVIDKNTFTIIDDFNNKNYLNISYRVVDIILILFVIWFFYKNNLSKFNFNIFNNIFFTFVCIFILIANQILKNSEIMIINYILFISCVIFLSILIGKMKKKYE